MQTRVKAGQLPYYNSVNVASQSKIWPEGFRQTFLNEDMYIKGSEQTDAQDDNEEELNADKSERDMIYEKEELEDVTDTGGCNKSKLFVVT